MPGSVRPVSLSTSYLGTIPVMPYSLAIAFQSSSHWEVDENTFPNGEIITNALVLPGIGFRRSWALTRKLTPTQLSTLQNFYNSVQGPLIAFKFYDVFETSPLYSYDDTGASTAGQYYCRFDGPLSKSILLGLSQLNFAIRQVE